MRAWSCRSTRNAQSLQVVGALTRNDACTACSQARALDMGAFSLCRDLARAVDGQRTNANARARRSDVGAPDLAGVELHIKHASPARRRLPAKSARADQATVEGPTSRKRQERTNQKTQDEPQRIVAQRLLSTLTILGFKLVVYKRSINTTTILSNTRVLV